MQCVEAVKQSQNNSFFFTFTPSPPFPHHNVCRQFSKTIQSNHPVKAFTQMDVMRRESRLLHDDDECDGGDDADKQWRCGEVGMVWIMNMIMIIR